MTDKAPDVPILQVEGSPADPAPLRMSDIHRIELRHGEVAASIVARMTQKPSTRRVVCLCQHVLLAEIEQCASEGATSIETVSEKTGLGVGACGGVRCTFTCAQTLVDARFEGSGGELMEARELVRHFHASPRTLAHALSVDADLASKNLLAQLDLLRAARASRK